jgi:hypothetical protein
MEDEAKLREPVFFAPPRSSGFSQREIRGFLGETFCFHLVW